MAATGLSTARSLNTIGVCRFIWHSSIFEVCTACISTASVGTASVAVSLIGCTGVVFSSMGGAVGFCALSWIGSRELMCSVTGSTNSISSLNC